MKQLLIFLFTILSLIAKTQDFELKDIKLIKYYEITNEAEKKIINNDLKTANIFYKDAFSEFKYPHAKDLYNSMKVALKVNDLKTAYSNYQTLKCMGKNFNENLIDIFKNFDNQKILACQNTVDLQYKEKLDSLYEIDQYYRRLSKGNYLAYKKEITKNDSIASVDLLKLIKKNGFPNEYRIGLGSVNDVFFQKFYYIIWHQLASNSISSQKVNFSNEIIKALNRGDIRPDIAGFLLDLNNGKNDYSYFSIYQFTKNNEIDCCYVSNSFFPEKRTEKTIQKISSINKNRSKIGLSTAEDEIKKNFFLLNNKDYVFSAKTFERFNFSNEEEIELFKKNLNLIKLNDSTH
ncbi:hypothetical protein [Chryseobacterium aquaticum]|uniref:hypothetical protein n=1 Tax=Chryseobacterium aquaticum TaxID=452084 RepID=UPI003F728FD2